VKYRHRFHAGNFADVHKHVALLALLQALQRKNKGLLYVDTHAGAGVYELAGPDPHRGAEARHGITLLLSRPEPQSQELRDYRLAVLRWRAEHARPRTYPGSAPLAAQALRSQDRALCCERQPQECRALRSCLAGAHRVRVECSDGYAQLAACLPPPERRALVLIDPPYEDPSEEIELALSAIGAALHRLANGVIALWYPLKDERWLARWQQSLTHRIGAPTLCLELWLYRRDARVALNGSGLMIINPPYRFDAHAALWQQELVGLLDAGQHGGSAVRALVGENARHAHT